MTAAISLIPVPIPPLAQAFSHLWLSMSVKSCAEVSDRRSAVVITTNRQPDAEADNASEYAYELSLGSPVRPLAAAITARVEPLDWADEEEVANCLAVDGFSVVLAFDKELVRQDGKSAAIADSQVDLLSSEIVSGIGYDQSAWNCFEHVGQECAS